MDNSLFIALRTVCSVLNKHAVQYLIVGGTAVALHGYFRRSMNAAGVVADKLDLDIWYNPTYGNYFNVLNALEELGQNVTKFKQEQTPNPKKSFFRYGFEKFTLDLLPELKAPLKFGTSFANRETTDLSEVSISFIGFDDLLAEKAANARPRDIDDIEQLIARRKSD
jgi:predicted nucleotidyltransferase